MRILLIDIDSLRADHLGCYGYHRDTSPTIDRLAAEGVRFARCYVSDAPCLPSRTAWATGRFGIHNGVVAHGGARAEPFNTSRGRVQDPAPEFLHWFQVLERAGYRTASISPFADRHAAWWYLAGLREWHNTGLGGMERADQINGPARRWLEEHADEEDWVLHVNYWDPHTPYRTPARAAGRFSDAPPPDWPDQAAIEAHWNGFGTLSARDPMAHWFPDALRLQREDVPGQIRDAATFRKWIDAYDEGVRYTDDHIAQLIELLEAKRLLDDTLVVVTADHGENQGELNVYGDHQTADEPTCHVPFVLRHPAYGAGRIDGALHYQFDLAATLLELAGASVPEAWHASSFAEALRAQGEDGRDELVLSQMAWSCQRSVVFDDWLYVRTYHEGLKDVQPNMLFDLRNDPHETTNLAERHPEVVREAQARLQDWHDAVMASALEPQDPLWTVLAEGGPSLPRGRLDGYLERLEATGRQAAAGRLRALAAGRGGGGGSG